ncbi:rho-related GTP-binding protein RhoJ-like [Mytilus galloprovincialis]|uniref:Ras homolog gene family, member Q n=3 Tax=Mytilus TaxID=6548 RepID=A0A8B6HKB9_MYTGA|nr:Ras homolog gene family, member Q [Mytilus galloprovincialis]
MKMEQNCIQCVIVGDGMVGKSHLAKCFVGQSLQEDYIATVFENYAGTLAVAGSKYTIGIFDSAGQQDYTNLRAFSYRDSDVFILCYNIADRESFKNIKSFWIPEIKQYNVKKRPIILVATQSDSRHLYEDSVTCEEGVELAKDIGAECLIETSAITREGTTETFERVVMSALKHKKKKYKIFQRLFKK